MKFIITGILITLSLFLNAQNKYGNTIGAEIFADAPFRMKMNDIYSNPQAIPVHIHVHDADGFGANVELMSIDIRIKNASDTIFDSILVFDTLSSGAFENMIIHRSVNNEDLDIQDFNSSQYETSADHTIAFKETHDIIDGQDYVSIESKFWYFTFLIPSEVLAGYDNIIDIMVYFNIDWSTDDETCLRVFRQEEDLPELAGWYRGDCHYHTMFTQNLVELGLPLEATKLAGKLIGLDWQFATDHSCDFDNFGVSIEDNWQKLSENIQQLNTEDPDYIFIRGLEMSIDNSDGKVVHGLAYPRENTLYSLPFFCDGDGDATGTDVTIQNIINGLWENNGFIYAAHPFAEGDKLPDLVNGSVWNINDVGFPVNDENHPSIGTVICNDLTIDSDIFSDDPNYLFKKSLRGFQIWNLYNTLVTHNNDNFDDAWNTHYNDDIDYFAPVEESDPMNMYYRLYQGIDVYKFLLRKGLIEKNANNTLLNWKTFMLGGSDAHGSFNFSNTNMSYATYGDIEINALGKISTLAYCPEGMGPNGENVVEAIYNGNTILSDGPILTISLSNGVNDDIIIGEDTCVTPEVFENIDLNIDVLLSEEFGTANYCKLYIGTEEQEHEISLQFDSGLQTYNLNGLLSDNFIELPNDKYFYIRAELATEKQYGELAQVYLTEAQNFHSFTNPIWLNISDNTLISDLQNSDNVIKYISIDDNSNLSYYLNSDTNIEIEIYNTLGQTITTYTNEFMHQGKHVIDLPACMNKNSVYLIRFKTSKGIEVEKLVL